MGPVITCTSLRETAHLFTLSSSTRHAFWLSTPICGVMLLSRKLSFMVFLFDFMSPAGA